MDKLKQEFDKDFPDKGGYAHGKHCCASYSEGQECCLNKDWFWEWINKNTVSNKKYSAFINAIISLHAETKGCNIKQALKDVGNISVRISEEFNKPLQNK